MTQKKTKQQKKKKFIYIYQHQHPLIFFTLVFNVFVITVILMINTMMDDLDYINARRIIFNEPNPVTQVKAEQMLAGTPMLVMAPYIAQQSDDVASYLIAIAKKESAWGEHKPVLNGEDCFNYWGFRKKQERMGSGGHTCFDNPEQAVKIVGRRIKDLIRKGYNTPEEMVLWKCGRCDGPEAAGANKWIQDVAYYKDMYDAL